MALTWTGSKSSRSASAVCTPPPVADIHHLRYPVAPERSGNDADFDNYVSFLRNLRDALGGSGHSYGLSITIPSSYWYMKNFDIVAIEKIIDWFNVMTYDLHGTWDTTDRYIGSIVGAHTNLTEIDQTMDLLWRNNIDPDKVVMGLGFYGRSFTLKDPSCSAPGCPFSSGGTPGQCTQSAGTLSASEIKRAVDAGAKVTTYKDAAVKVATFGGNQCESAPGPLIESLLIDFTGVSYDDADTFKQKIDYANSHCLGGTMIWAVSLDNSAGDIADSLSKVTGQKQRSLERISPSFDAGGACFETDCQDKPGCPSGYGAAQITSGKGGDVSVHPGCKKGQSRTVCCPSNDMPTCRWLGNAPGK